MKKSSIFKGSFLIVAILSFLTFSWRNRSPFPPYRFLTQNRSSQLSDSIQVLEKQINQNTPDPFQLASLASLKLAQAQSTGKKNDYDQAENLARKSLTILPHPNFQSLLVLARIAEANHDFDKAIDLSKKTLGTSHKKEAISILVTSYLAKGELTEASHWADTLVLERPSVDTYSLRALVLNAQGRESEAEYDFLRALKVEDIDENISSAWARAQLAKFYIKKGKLYWAEELLKECSKIIPKYPLAISLQGELESARGHFSKAAEKFLEAFTLTRQVNYLRLYALAQEKNGQEEIARESRNEAELLMRKELSQGNLGHRMDLALILLDSNQLSKAPEAIQLMEAEVKFRKSSQVFYTLAKSYRLAQRWRQAQEAIQASLRTGIRDEHLYLEAAMIEEKLGNLSKKHFFENLAQQVNANHSKSLFPSLLNS